MVKSIFQKKHINLEYYYYYRIKYLKKKNNIKLFFIKL